MPAKEVVIIGGGIVGLSTALKLSERHPEFHLTILEKETHLAEHQTGRNSGVIHSGIYYKPGSVKANTCRRGKALIEEFAMQEGVAFETCGKVIVALNESELPMLQTLHDRGQANGVSCELIGPERLRELEPHVAGIRAIHVHETGIIDYVGFCNKIAYKLKASGNDIKFGHQVTGISKVSDEFLLKTSQGEVRASYIVNCAGLYSDRVTKMAGLKPDLQIVPFRGEYYGLEPEAEKFCRNLIYPVPDPNFPFLGVHFTRMIGGGVECGPNAVLAFGRECYKNTQVNFGELAETLRFGGFRKLASKYWKTGMGEMWRSYNKAAFVKALRRLVPELEAKHIHPIPAGIRAQAIAGNGTPVDDFAFDERPGMVHVLNAPSPAATAALAIGEEIVAKLEQNF